MGKVLTLGHGRQQDGTVPYPLSPLVLGCFAVGWHGTSLRAAIPVPGTAPHEPCLELLTLPVTSAVVSAGLISATAIRRPYTGPRIGTSLGRRHKGRGTELLLEGNSLPRQVARQLDPLLLCRTSASPFPPAARSRGRWPEPSCAPVWACHAPCPCPRMGQAALPLFSRDVAPGAHRAGAAASSSSSRPRASHSQLQTAFCSHWACGRDAAAQSQDLLQASFVPSGMVEAISPAQYYPQYRYHTGSRAPGRERRAGKARERIPAPAVGNSPSLHHN